jgi:hypothetical protein
LFLRSGSLENHDKAEYDAKVGKWYVANVNGKPVSWEAVYNVSASRKKITPSPIRRT